MNEQRLEFGMVSNPVRIGNTVHRDAGPWTATIHSLLSFLGDQQFYYVPKVLGFDPQGREILSYIEGDGAVRPWPSVLFTDNGLLQAAKLLRKYHDTVEGFQPAPHAQWRFGNTSILPGQVILHGDLGPWNTIWRDGTICGLIDWDFAHPGTRLEDLAQLAYYFVPLRSEEGWVQAGFSSRPNFRSRLEVLTGAYGIYTPSDVYDAIPILLDDHRRRTTELSQRGIEPWVDFVKRGDLREDAQDIKWIESMRSELRF